MDDFDSQLIGGDPDSLQLENLPLPSASQDSKLDDCNDVGGDDDDDDLMTPAEIVKAMHDIWLNESAAPKLLTQQATHVDYLIDQSEHMQSNIARLPDAERKSLKCTVHAMEIQRIAYVVNDYLRVRMQKIEKDPVRAMQKDDERLAQSRERLLSAVEREFAEKFLDASANLMKTELLQSLPACLNRIPVPKTNHGETRVFFEVLEDGVDNMIVPHMQDVNSEIVVALPKGSRHFAPFASVEEFLDRGQVRLL